jgi:hypothetical protein
MALAAARGANTMVDAFLDTYPEGDLATAAKALRVQLSVKLGQRLV